MISLPIGQIEGVVSRILYSMEMIPLLIVAALVGLLSLISIFLYKNRVLQRKLVRLNIFLSVVLLGGSAFFFFFNNATMISSYGIAAIFPLLILLFNILAASSITKDVKLVQSMDRLR